jgi:hypothetical protein
MARETADYVNRRVVDGGEAFAQLDECLGFNPLDQVNQDVVENSDLLFIESVSLIKK